jgi:hypothetical protein
MNANKIGFVQGDVIGHYVSELPAEAKLSKQRIVAYGESTGHHHIVEGVKEAYEVAEGFYFVVAPEENATLVHIGNDHDTIKLLPGIIYVPRESQVEYDGEEERRVLD